MPSFAITAAGVLGATGVALGAFGAHWLETAVTEWGLDPSEQTRRLETWEIAVRYQLLHAVTLLGVGLLGLHSKSKCLRVATGCFLLGTIIFSGCLYVLVVSGIKILGAIVPIGGVALVVGWISLLGVRADK